MVDNCHCTVRSSIFGGIGAHRGSFSNVKPSGLFTGKISFPMVTVPKLSAEAVKSITPAGQPTVAAMEAKHTQSAIPEIQHTALQQESAVTTDKPTLPHVQILPKRRTVMADKAKKPPARRKKIQFDDDDEEGEIKAVEEPPSSAPQSPQESPKSSPKLAPKSTPKSSPKSSPKIAPVAAPVLPVAPIALPAALAPTVRKPAAARLPTPAVGRLAPAATGPGYSVVLPASPAMSSPGSPPTPAATPATARKTTMLISPVLSSPGSPPTPAATPATDMKGPGPTPSSVSSASPETPAEEESSEINELMEKYWVDMAENMSNWSNGVGEGRNSIFVAFNLDSKEKAGEGALASLKLTKEQREKWDAAKKKADFKGFEKVGNNLVVVRTDKSKVNGLNKVFEQYKSGTRTSVKPTTPISTTARKVLKGAIAAMTTGVGKAIDIISPRNLGAEMDKAD